MATVSQSAVVSKPSTSIFEDTTIAGHFNNFQSKAGKDCLGLGIEAAALLAFITANPNVKEINLVGFVNAKGKGWLHIGTTQRANGDTRREWMAAHPLTDHARE